MPEDRKCRFAVRDEEGSFIGFKADSFWTLSSVEKLAELHSVRDANIEGPLVKAYLDLINRESTTEEPVYHRGRLGPTQIVVETINHDGTATKWARYQITKDREGIYQAREA